MCLPSAVPGNGHLVSASTWIEVIQLTWWGYVLFLLAVAVAIWGFLSLVKFRTKELTRKTDRTAQDLYPSYADSLRKQHQFAREHGSQWQDDGGPARGSEGTKS
jgi:hypothetical protein